MFASVEPLESRIEEIVRKRRELDALEAEWLALVSEYEHSGDWHDDGYFNAASALRSECRITSGAAHAHVRAARRLAELPKVAGAYAAGDIGREHVSVITRAFTNARENAFRELEPTFVEAARRMDPKDLAGVVDYVCGAIDGDGGDAGDYNSFLARKLHVSSTLDGVGYVKGQLDAEGTETVDTALAAVMERDRKGGDDRTVTQRRADALVAICRWILEHGVVGGSRKVRPQVNVVVDVQALPGATPELEADLRAETAHFGRLSAATLERLTCDCRISRVITAGRSEILDVGRSTRTVPPALWRALVVRDGGCTHLGCDRPPDWCEAHHKRHWAAGGPTSLDNLELLCWYHHQLRHHHDAKWRKPGPARLRAS